MKLLKPFLIVTMFLLTPFLIHSQEEKSIQGYWIHEDRVKPSMIQEYEQISKDLVVACKEHNIQDTQWLAMSLDDNSYLYISPIENLADLDKNAFATLGEKMGKEKLNELFNRYNTTYDEHGDYVVYLHKDLSYMPGGVSQTIEGQNYRTLYYNYVTPENDKNFTGVMKKMKKAFEKHNSKMHYRVYKTGFGVMGTYYLVAIAGESNLESARLSDENWELMSDDFQSLLNELMKFTWKSDQKTGWMREDLGFLPVK